MKYEKEFKRYFSKIQSFTFKDARRFLRKLGASDNYIKLFMHIQTERHGLLRISKGNYTFMNNDAVVGFAFSPFYYGMEHALTIHGLWTQMTNPVVVTKRKAVPGVREGMGHRFIVRRISSPMFFGVEYVRYGGLFVPVSDVEKTFIDFIYFRIPISEEDMNAILKACDVKKLQRYSRRCSSRLRAILEKKMAKLGYG